jgi:TonB family protein
VALLVVATAMIPRPKRDVERGAQLSGGTSTIQNAARATGRVKVVSTSGSATYKVYATGGSFAEAGKSLVARTDTLTKAVASGLNSAGDVFDIDVTNGDVHFVSQGTSSLHVEAAMSGVSRAQWLSMTGRHVVIESGGAGVRGGDLRRDLGQAKTPFFEFQVDTPAIARETVNPRYPEALKKSGISGEVWAQFVVDTTGRVDMGTFKALKSPDPEFTAAIKAVLPAWRFDPAMTRGKKIKQLVQQAFVFGRPPQL